MKIRHFFEHPSDILESILIRIGGPLPDRLYLKWLYRLKTGCKLNLDNPHTFSEKLQWLKLYNRNPEYTTMVDKYAVKDYVANIIGRQFIIPTLGVWERPEDIDWDLLPDKFVLKTTTGAGGADVVICRDKNSLDRRATISKLRKSMKKNIYRLSREWPYKNVPIRIIAEKYIEPSPETDDLPDYKFFCFNGKPKYCQLISGRGNKMCIDFFDKDWNHQPFHEPKNYPFAEVELVKPKHFEEMWHAAASLSEGLPFSRIDFYDVNERTYFGEITFFPTSGMGGFDPETYDTLLGRMIDLTNV